MHLSESKKCHVKLVEWLDHKAAEKLQPIRNGGGGRRPVSSSWEDTERPTGSGGKRTKKHKKVVKGKPFFAREADGEGGTDNGHYTLSANPTRSESEGNNKSGEKDRVKKWKVNSKLGLLLLGQKVLTKNTLLREAQECETLRRKFWASQEKI